jgi:ATP-binding cassette subfamily F protein 3
MESCDALLAAFDNFKGAVIIVTHNELLLHGIAQRLVVFQKNTIDVFEGSYQRFLEKLGWDDEKAMEQKQLSEKRTASENITKKEKRRRRSEIIQKRSKALKPIQKQIDTIEQKIDTNESKLKTLEQDMLLASNLQDKKKIVVTSKEIRTCQNAIKHLFDQLETLTQDFDQKHDDFEKQLNPLN